MSFKVYQLAESTPQFVLNCSMIMNTYALGGKPNNGECVNQLAWLLVKTIFSLASITFTKTSVFSSMPVETEEKVGSPLAPSSYKYLKVLPNMALVTSSRMIVLSLICSLAVGETEDWIFYLSFFLVLSVLYSISFWFLAHYMRKKDSQNRKILEGNRLQGFFTSLTGPCVIGRIDSHFYMASSILSSTFYILALVVLLAFALASPDTIFMTMPSNNSTTAEQKGNATNSCEPEHLSIPDQAYYLQVYCYIGIGAISFCILVSYNLLHLFKKQNIALVIKNMVDSKNLGELKTYFSK